MLRCWIHNFTIEICLKFFFFSSQVKEEADDNSGTPVGRMGEEQPLDDEKEAGNSANQREDEGKVANQVSEVLEEQKKQVAERNRLEALKLEIQQEKEVGNLCLVVQKLLDIKYQPLLLLPGVLCDLGPV